MEQIIKNFIDLFKNEDAFIPADPAQLESLKALMGDKCSVVIDFFGRYQPDNVPMTDSYVSLLNIEKIVEENTVGEPGRFLAAHGVYVIALTVGGNVICIDSNNSSEGDPSVLIADSGFCSYNEFRECVEIGIAPEEIFEEVDDDILPLNYHNIVRCLPKIEDSFIEFMTKLSNDEYEDIEEYLEQE